MWVLTYHSISEGPPPLCTTSQQLAEQIDFLLGLGWEPTSLRASVDEFESAAPASLTSAPRFAVTFDDGYRDFADHALPVLEARNIPATLFSVATYEREKLAGGIDGMPLLQRDELRELAQRGVEIAGHGIEHVDLTRLDASDLELEVRQGRERMADWIGRDVVHFAYPFGAWNARVREAAAREYRAAFTTQLAAMGPDADPHAIPRVDAFYLDDPGFRRAIEAGSGESWLRKRRWLRRARGSEPRRAIPRRRTSARSIFHANDKRISPMGKGAAAPSSRFEALESYRTWL